MNSTRNYGLERMLFGLLSSIFNVFIFWVKGVQERNKRGKNSRDANFCQNCAHISFIVLCPGTLKCGLTPTITTKSVAQNTGARHQPSTAKHMVAPLTGVTHLPLYVGNPESIDP